MRISKKNVQDPNDLSEIDLFTLASTLLVADNVLKNGVEANIGPTLMIPVNVLENEVEENIAHPEQIEIRVLENGLEGNIAPSFIIPVNILDNEVEENIAHSQQIEITVLKGENLQNQCSTMQTQQQIQQMQIGENQKLQFNTRQFDEGAQNIQQQQKLQSSLQLKCHQYEQPEQNTQENVNIFDQKKQEPMQTRQLQQNAHGLQHEQQHQNKQTHQNEDPHQNEQLEYHQGSLNIGREQNQRAIQQFQILQVHQNEPLEHNMGPVNTQDQQVPSGFDQLQPHHNTIRTHSKNPVSVEEVQEEPLQKFQQTYVHNGHDTVNFQIGSQPGTKNFQYPQTQQQLYELQVQHYMQLQYYYWMQHMYPQLQQHRLPLYYYNTANGSHKYEPNYQPCINKESHTLQHRPQLPNLNNGHLPQTDISSERVTTKTLKRQRISQILRSLEMPITNESSELISQLLLPPTNGHPSQVKGGMPEMLPPPKIPIANHPKSPGVHTFQTPITNGKRRRTNTMDPRQLPFANLRPIVNQHQMFIPNEFFQPTLLPFYRQLESQRMYFNNNVSNSAEDFENKQPIKKRRFHTEEQILELENSFHRCEYPSKIDIVKLSISTGLTEKQIKSWFRNHRIKHQRDDETTAKQDRQ